MANVVIDAPRQGLARSFSLASIPDSEDTEEDTSASKESNQDRLLSSSNFNVLRLDLKLGSHHTSPSAATLVSQLEKSSIANRLDERIATSVNHIDRLRLRVEDTSSKVLVTGPDLNAGKSTFVNALLRREVMPAQFHRHIGTQLGPANARPRVCST